MTNPLPARRVSGEAAMRALSHPYRRRLLDALSADGPSTVGQLAERTAAAIGSVSHHLKVLAGAGLVVPAPERARDQRESWWKRTGAISWTRGDASPAEQALSDAAEATNAARHSELWENYRSQAEALPEWADAAFVSDFWLRLTPAELAALGDELRTVLERWRTLHPPAAGDTADTADATAPADAADRADAADATDHATAADSTDRADAADPADTTDLAEAADWTDQADAADPANPTDPADAAHQAHNPGEANAFQSGRRATSETVFVVLRGFPARP